MPCHNIISPIITRLAPSPTGNLHLGNIWSFLICWLAARQTGGKVFLRIDDIDTQRSRQEYVREIFYDLKWLGMDWDPAPIIQGPDGAFFQTMAQQRYEYALHALQGKNLIYPCFCSRKDLKMLASAPHMEDNGIVYPGTCAQLDQKKLQEFLSLKKPFALRFRCANSIVEFNDLICGPQKFLSYDFGGDFPVKRSDGIWSYQFATVLDDALMGVTLVARGNDLLSSTPRQILLARSLGYTVPQYAHIPLLLDNSGQRLAKRHKSMSIASLRARGIPPEHILGRLAQLAGLNPDGAPRDIQELTKNFILEVLPKNDLILPADWFGA